MFNTKKIFLFILVSILNIQIIVAQTKKVVSHYADFEKKWIGQPFPIDLNKHKPIIGTQINAKLKTMVVFGFYHCLPCRNQMPALLAFADTAQKNNIVYITFDDINLVMHELKEAGWLENKVNNLMIYSVSKELLNDSGLVSFGYPIKYFVDASNIIFNIDTYTDKDLNKDQLQQKWYNYINNPYNED